MALTKEDLQAIAGLIDSKLDEKFDEKLSPIIERLDEINKRLDGINEQLDGINEQLDRINEQLDGINKPLTGLMNDLIKLKKTPKLQNARLIPFSYARMFAEEATSTSRSLLKKKHRLT